MKAALEELIDQMITQGILFEEGIKEFEKRFILDMLSRQHNNLSKAATALGIHRNTLTKRLREYKQDSSPRNNGRRQVARRKKTGSAARRKS